MAFRNWKQELEDTRPARPSPWPFAWRAGVVVLLLVGTAAGALWVWPGYLLPKPWQRPGPAPGSITIVFSSDVHGYLEPCGCTEQRWGGIARTSGYLADLTGPATRLAMDVGHMTAGRLAWQQLGLRVYLEALASMDYLAANLGAGELVLDAADLRSIAESSPTTLLSANAIDAATEHPLVATHKKVLVDNLRVTVVGVVQVRRGDRLGEGVAVADPHEALGSLLPQLRGDTDVIVLLAACEEPMLRELAEAHPEIDVILGGRVQQASKEIRRVGRCWIAYQASKGQMLGRVDVRIRPDGRADSAVAAMVVLDNDVPEDTAMLERIEQYNAELARLGREGGLKALGIEITPRPGGPNTYAGSDTCKQCHPSAYAMWKSKEHSRAWSLLVKRQRHNNPDCMRCHVVDFGVADGFRGVTLSLSPDRVNVQCEACHGRSSQHVRARRAGLSKNIAKHTKVLPKSCETCHDCVHSPKFVYKTYWEKLKHARETDQGAYPKD